MDDPYIAPFLSHSLQLRQGGGRLDTTEPELDDSEPDPSSCVDQSTFFSAAGAYA